ncbi:hypothetical protein [Roseicyclus sp.]
MARDRERHVKGRDGAKPAPQDDMPPETNATRRADHRFRTTATTQPDRPDGHQQHGHKSLEERIENALRVVAELLEQDEAYLPIFLRLEAERDKLDARRAALDRARAVLRETPPRSRSGPAPRP